MSRSSSPATGYSNSARDPSSSSSALLINAINIPHARHACHVAAIRKDRRHRLPLLQCHGLPIPLRDAHIRIANLLLVTPSLLRLMLLIAILSGAQHAPFLSFANLDNLLRAGTILLPSSLPASPPARNNHPPSLPPAWRRMSNPPATPHVMRL